MVSQPFPLQGGGPMATITLAAQLKCLKKPSIRKTPTEDNTEDKSQSLQTPTMVLKTGPTASEQLADKQTKQAASSLQPLPLEPSGDKSSSEIPRYFHFFIRELLTTPNLKKTNSHKKLLILLSIPNRQTH